MRRISTPTGKIHKTSDLFELREAVARR